MHVHLYTQSILYKDLHTCQARRHVYTHTQAYSHVYKHTSRETNTHTHSTTEIHKNTPQIKAQTARTRHTQRHSHTIPPLPWNAREKTGLLQQPSCCRRRYWVLWYVYKVLRLSQALLPWFESYFQNKKLCPKNNVSPSTDRKRKTESKILMHPCHQFPSPHRHNTYRNKNLRCPCRDHPRPQKTNKTNKTKTKCPTCYFHKRLILPIPGSSSIQAAAGLRRTMLNPVSQLDSGASSRFPWPVKSQHICSSQQPPRVSLRP